MVLCLVCDWGLCRVGEGWGLMIDRGNRGPGFVGHQDPRPKTVLQTKSKAIIAYEVGKGKPIGVREGGRCWC